MGITVQFSKFLFISQTYPLAINLVLYPFPFLKKQESICSVIIGIFVHRCMSYRSNSLFTFWYFQKCMVIIDCLIEVAVFTVYVVALDGMGRERPWHAYSCIHFKDFVRTATNLSSSPAFTLPQNKKKEGWMSRVLRSSVHDSAGLGMVHFEDRTGKICEIFRQHSFSLSCETAPNTVLQDTRTNNNGKQIMNLVTF